MTAISGIRWCTSSSSAKEESSNRSSTSTIPPDCDALYDAKYEDFWGDAITRDGEFMVQIIPDDLRHPQILQKSKDQEIEHLEPFGMRWEDFTRSAKSHFRTDVDSLQADTLPVQIDEALSAVSNTRFINPRALTQLDALITSVFVHKPSLEPTLHSLLTKSVTQSFLENRLSYATFAFLIGACASIRAEAPASIVAMLKQQYSEEMGL